MNQRTQPTVWRLLGKGTEKTNFRRKDFRPHWSVRTLRVCAGCWRLLCTIRLMIAFKKRHWIFKFRIGRLPLSLFQTGSMCAVLIPSKNPWPVNWIGLCSFCRVSAFFLQIGKQLLIFKNPLPTAQCSSGKCNSSWITVLKGFLSLFLCLI